MWSDGEAVAFFDAIHRGLGKLGTGVPRVSHETHRGRLLSSPFSTARILDALPVEKRPWLTSDFSHWVTTSGLSFPVVSNDASDFPLKRARACAALILNLCSLAERLLDTPKERELLARLVPSVVHLHARLGTPQTPQVDRICNAHQAESRERFYQVRQCPRGQV